MRYLFGFLCVCALGVIPLVGCSETQAMPECEVAADCNDDNECTEDTCTGGLCDNKTVEAGTACSSGACLGGECTALVTVSGTVISDESDAVEGATVLWLGSTLNTTTNESGAFSFEVPIGDLFLQASKAGTWGEIVLVSTEGGSELEFEITSDTVMAQFAQDLGIDFDETKGIVGITFLDYSELGGESATLSESYGSSWVEDANNNAVMSDALVEGGLPWLDFINVDLTDELTVMPSGAEAVNNCSLAVPNTVYPVVAKFFTSVYAVCTPLR